MTPEDAGNNFFLEGQSSIGKSRAQEAVRLLSELNEGVEGKADLRSLEDVLEKDQAWLFGFTILIAHNLDPRLLERLSGLLWQDELAPPLVLVRSAGFLAEFYIQFREHRSMFIDSSTLIFTNCDAVIDSHSETTPSLRIDKPFPALLEYALSLDLDNMDQTDHGHIPYVVILVRVLEEWKKSVCSFLIQHFECSLFSAQRFPAVNLS